MHHKKTMRYQAQPLLGGKSKRFGFDKRLYEVNGKYIISNVHQIDGFNKPYQGPFFGIFSALLQIQTKRCIFILVDMPFINEQMIEVLIQAGNQYEVAYFTLDIYPLPGLYSKSILPLPENFLIKSFLKSCPNNIT